MNPRTYYGAHQSGESFTTTKPGAKEDNVPPPKIAPPVFISVPPPPPVPAQGAPVPPMRSRPPPGGGHVGPHPPFGPHRRNVPVRSQSMSIADINRFYGSPPLPRFRPPPPPGQQQGQPRAPAPNNHAKATTTVEITELGGGDSGSENEDEMQRKAKPKKHFIHHNNQVIVEDIPGDSELDFIRKYKTLDPSRSRSHHHSQVISLEPTNYNSLERGTNRRRLPTVPNSHSHNSLNTQSLPRPPKLREQSESRSRDRYVNNSDSPIFQYGPKYGF